MNAFVNFSIQLANESVPSCLNDKASSRLRSNIFPEIKHMASNSLQTDSVNNLTRQLKASDLLMMQLQKALSQSAVQNLLTFPELIQLTEKAVNAFKSDYFEIDDNYTDVMIMDKISLAVGYLSKIASDSALATSTKLRKLEEERSNLAGKKADIYKQTQGKTKEYNECMARMQGLSSKHLQIEKDKDEYSLEAARERERIAKIEEKQRKLKKWCWVPGYGLYLYIDAEYAAANLKGILQRLRTAEQAMNSLQMEECRLSQELRTLSGSGSKLDKDIFLIEQALFECIDDINFTSSKVVQYAEVALFFGKIAAQFKFPDCDSHLVLKSLGNIRMDIGNLFEKGAIAERCTCFIEGLKYRSNAIYNGDNLGKGEYLSSLNRQYVAIMCNDDILRLYNTEKCIGELGTDIVRNIFTGKNGCLDLRKLCITDSGKLVCNIGGENENFDGHISYSYTPVNGTISTNNSFFYVKSYNYSGTYIIKNENSLVLDVAFASQTENAVIITYQYHGGGNQKFVIERQPDLTYKISAVHSGKVLTLNCHNKIVQSVWEAADNQKWLIIGNDDRIVKLINIQNGKAVDIPMNSSASSIEMWAYPDNGTSAQRFKLARP